MGVVAAGLMLGLHVVVGVLVADGRAQQDVVGLGAAVGVGGVARQQLLGDYGAAVVGQVTT